MIAKTKVIPNIVNLPKDLETIKVLDPEYVYIATDNARCPKSDVYIQEGDEVKLYQEIGMRHGPFFDQPIHATVSGTFVGYETHCYRNGKPIKFIKIKNDFKDTPAESAKERTDEEIKALSKDDMTKIIANMSNVGLGGSSFPTAVKFQTKDKIEHILINAIECEPYLNADHRAMLEVPDQIIAGLHYIMQAFECNDCIICIKKKYHDLYDAYTKVLENEPNIRVQKLENYYPQGWEVAMIKECLGIKLKTGELPAKRGIINFNISTVIGIYKAIKLNQPVIERDITVNGDGIKQPMNFRVRVGTPIRPLIDKYCGGYVDPEKPKVFILGGPMMGASEPSDDCVVSKTVTSCLVLNERKYVEEPCVRCGSCVYSCPVGLEPVQIMNAVKVMDKERIKALNPLRCIECGLCTYSCTSKIKVTDFVRRAKVFAKL